MNIELEPIGYVRAARPHAEDDFWGGEEATITLLTGFTADALQGLSDFSHAEIIFLFHEVEASKVVTGARHPRNNKHWPAVGIFSQRGKNRPNRIGTTICRVVRCEGTSLVVAELTRSTARPYSTSSPYWQSSCLARTSSSRRGRTN